MQSGLILVSVGMMNTAGYEVLGLASLSNLYRFWDIVAVNSCLTMGFLSQRNSGLVI